MLKKDFDFSTGLHTNDKLNGFKAMIYDKLKEDDEEKNKQRQLKKFDLPKLNFNFFDD